MGPPGVSGSFCARLVLAAYPAPASSPTIASLSQEEPHSPLGGAPERIALVTRGESAAGMHRRSPTKDHFSKIRKCNQPTRYTDDTTLRAVEPPTRPRLECLRETGLSLRCDRKVGNPFQTKQGSRPSRPDQEGMIFLPAILIPACASSSPTFLMMYSA